MEPGAAAAIILAAGLSSRMGDFKPMLRLGKYTLVEHCAHAFREAGVDNIVLVTGHNADQLSAHGKELDLRIVVNRDYRSGMFSSVQAGVGDLPASTKGFFMLPVDIPLIRPATLKLLLNRFLPDHDEVLIPCFFGEQGHPPLIAGSLIPKIQKYDGSGGLQALLANHGSRKIAVWDRFTLRDADTKSDFGYLQEQYRRRTIPTRMETTGLQNELVHGFGHGHGLLVGKIGVLIGEELNNRGYNLDLDLIYAGGCLHDLAKGALNHGEVAAQRLRELGLKEVADTVEHHSSIPLGEGEQLDERHLVCLADKLVSCATIVEPKQRYLDKLKKYQNDPYVLEIIKSKMRDCLALQNMLKLSCNGLLSISSGRS